jgi:hypothetical protein
MPRRYRTGISVFPGSFKSREKSEYLFRKRGQTGKN